MHGTYGRRPVGRSDAYAWRPRGRFPFGFAPVLLAFAGFLTLASAGAYFPLFPLVPMFLLLFFFAGPAIGRFAARGVGSRRSPEVRPVGDGGEKELLRALERNGEITAARVALETSLGVAEADKMLAKLAAGGHLEVRARDGHLTYALRDADRRVIRPKKLTSAHEGTSGTA